MLMKSITYALATGVAALVAAAPAQAATVLFTSGTNIDLVETDGIYSGAFEAVALEDGNDANFMATFTFTTPFAGNAIASAISIALNPRSNIDFDAIAINGVFGRVLNGMLDTAFTDAVLVPGGENRLSIMGRLNPPSGQGTAGFGGNVTFAAAGLVPEPATWGLFILGFGAIGGALRRRNSALRINKASLRFS